jgi:hypothetical protein
MEQKTKTFPNGKVVTYQLTKDKGFFTRNIWVTKDGKPYLRFMPSTAKGFSRCSKFVNGVYVPMGDINTDFDRISLETIYLS